MGSLLLCRSSEGRHPYFVKELGINIGTAEELSYYIYNHAFFLDESFLDDRLFAFLSSECHMSALEKKLKNWMRDGADFVSLMLVIQQDIHYYTEAELVTFRDNLTRIYGASPAERTKWQADFMMQRQRFDSALRLYDAALRLEKEAPDGRLRGQILCNRGSVYAQLFSFRDAMDCFVKAYECLAQEDILKRIFILRNLDPSIPLPAELLDRIPALKKKHWQEELELARRQAAYSGKSMTVREILEKNSVRRREELEQLLVSWKQEYRDFMR